MTAYVLSDQFGFIAQVQTMITDVLTQEQLGATAEHLGVSTDALTEAASAGYLTDDQHDLLHDAADAIETVTPYEWRGGEVFLTESSTWGTLDYVRAHIEEFPCAYLAEPGDSESRVYVSYTEHGWLIQSSILGRTNAQYVTDRFPGTEVEDVSQGAYVVEIVQHTGALDQDLLKFLATPMDYPCYDERLYSEIHYDAVVEAVERESGSLWWTAKDDYPAAVKALGSEQGLTKALVEAVIRQEIESEEVTGGAISIINPEEWLATF